MILAGDHIYKMDYSIMLQDHVASGFACTVGCIEVPKSEATSLGVMGVTTEHKITSFVEKPDNPTTLADRPNISLASMGIYIFNADYLYKLLDEDIVNSLSSHDFGKDIIPKVVSEGQAFAHPFGMSCVQLSDGKAYWRDVGTVDAFWEANLDLASNMPELNLYDHNWPIWTYQEQLPPAKFVQDSKGVNGVVFNTLISGGCIVSGSHISHTVMFSNVRVESFCKLMQTVILPGTYIGENCRLKKVVIDRGCNIPAGTVIGEDADQDSKRFYRSENGIVLVTRKMLAKLN
jgi:glucose-1-phosphate adenylyltransferase